MVFTENDSSYSLQAEVINSPEEINSGLWLVIAGIDGIPPHIALINEGRYFSVSAKRVEAGIPLQNFLKAISKRSVPTVFIQLKNVGNKTDLLKSCFEKYPTLGNGDHSCLWPIRDFSAQSYSEKYRKSEFVFELLAMAQKDNLILVCKSLYIDSLISSPPQMGRWGGAIVLSKYNHSQIRERINSILKVT